WAGTPRSDNGRYPSVTPVLVIAVTCGGMAGVRVPLHWIVFRFSVAGAATFAKVSPPPGLVTVRATFAAPLEKLATRAEQLVDAAVVKVVGVHVLVRDTTPCLRLKATGIVTVELVAR